ncbi:CPCC family cysteine-rich protein, partial [Campylobacter rectus]|uniref:CPCC family cysteine-rich protein n=1 Tax=Campylobacter rectus TaxID=203 RepID=UPI000FB36C6F
MIRCPCCGYLTMKYINANDGFCIDICKVCFWQFDNISNSDPDRSRGPNSVSLNQAKENYKKMGAMEERFLHFVRPP